MRTRAELLFYIGMNYSKLPISISDQISLLKGRGLVIGDDAYAKEQLGIISYFRLADYLQPLEDNHSLHTFKSDATFEDAVTLYYFDKELRSLIFTAIQSIEIALRSKMINHCALRYGAHWFMDFEWFKDRSILILFFLQLGRPWKLLHSVPFQKCMRTLKRRLSRGKLREN